MSLRPAQFDAQKTMLAANLHTRLSLQSIGMLAGGQVKREHGDSGLRQRFVLVAEFEQADVKRGTNGCAQTRISAHSCTFLHTPCILRTSARTIAKTLDFNMAYTGTRFKSWRPLALSDFSTLHSNRSTTAAHCPLSVRSPRRTPSNLPPTRGRRATTRRL